MCGAVTGAEWRSRVELSGGQENRARRELICPAISVCGRGGVKATPDKEDSTNSLLLFLFPLVIAALLFWLVCLLCRLLWEERVFLWRVDCQSL
jgi:hypothetical protein